MLLHNHKAKAAGGAKPLVARDDFGLEQVEFLYGIDGRQVSLSPCEAVLEEKCGASL